MIGLCISTLIAWAAIATYVSLMPLSEVCSKDSGLAAFPERCAIYFLQQIVKREHEGK